MSKRRLPIPLILLIPIVMLAVVIVAGVYRFSLTNEDIGQKQGWYKAKPDEVMLQLFSYKEGKPFTLSVPDSKIKVALTHFVGEGADRRVIGEFNTGEERGSVSYDMFQTNMLNFLEPADNMVFVAPYAVSNQGSGTFHYLGLFELLESEQRVKQLDSLFIGDRIEKTTVEIDTPFDVTSSVLVKYMSHGENQAMAEAPNKPAVLTVVVTPTQFEK